MGDLISTHLDEGKREIITARTKEVMGEFCQLYEKQYAVALFNQVRFDVEGGGGPQPQLLHRKVPLENKSIFSGALFQYLEENKKWRNRFVFIPDSYAINYYENKQAHDRGLHPKGTINCAGYKVLTSMEAYLELLNTALPDVKAKVSSSPFLKCATQFPLILWHPYARHHYFCVTTEKEHQKWNAVFQDCVRHTNNGLSEENKVQTPAFTDAVRLYRQAHGQYGTWDMMCGTPTQILANLVMEKLVPELRDLIAPRLKGKLFEKQKSWILICDAVYGLVQTQTQAEYQAIVERCEAGRPPLENSIRTDMDQIITSKEHVTGKVRALVLPKAEKLLKVSIQPYIGSILEALMVPTSRGFSEVREVFFRELVDMSKNLLNQGGKEKLGEHMEKISMLAFHPVKMQSCYEKVEALSLEGLQQRFDVSSPSVFVQRAQILMREQMDDAVYTFEQLLHQSLASQEGEDMCKTIQRCQDRVIKKFDYDSSTVRKRFFREALLQIFIPYMLKQLSPSCSTELPRFQELIFEDFSRFILVESIFEEVVLQTVMKDIMMAVKEAAVQRRHNLYRDSIVLTDSDPNLHLLEDNPAIDWAGQYGGQDEEGDAETVDGADGEAQRRRRMKQVVSMIQIDGTTPLPSESCLEVPGVEGIPEESEAGPDVQASSGSEAPMPNGATSAEDVQIPDSPEAQPALTNGNTSKKEEGSSQESPVEKEPTQESLGQDSENKLAIASAIQEIEDVVKEEENQQSLEATTQKAEEISPPNQEQKSEPEKQEEGDTSVNDKEEHASTDQKEMEAPPDSVEESSPTEEEEITTAPSNEAENSQTATEDDSHSPSELEQPTTDSGHRDDSGFQSPTNGAAEEEKPQSSHSPSKATENHNDSETGEELAGKGATPETPPTNEE
ncbi:protein Niban 2b [Chanos chanos]|uniref:Protein Niban 2b n=1 Tax=Chanos chanos TaxID=29144 RepID=A0A6J2WTP0_CHACN|nr:protein Niban 2-like [Chanos chanos]